MAGNIRGEKKAIPIPKGTNILINVVGTHYNRTYLVSSADVSGFIYFDDEKYLFSARYWDDPHTFKPSRFLKDWPRDAFLPFSAGEMMVFLFLKNLPFFHYRNMQEPVRALDESMWILLLSNKSIFLIPFLLFFSSFFFFHRFAETEATAVLAMLVSHYKITIKEEPQFVNETFEERKSRILTSTPVLTLA